MQAVDAMQGDDARLALAHVDIALDFGPYDPVSWELKAHILEHCDPAVFQLTSSALHRWIVQCLEEAIRADSGRINAWSHLYNVAARMGDHARSLEAVREAIRCPAFDELEEDHRNAYRGRLHWARVAAGEISLEGDDLPPGTGAEATKAQLEGKAPIQLDWAGGDGSIWALEFMEMRSLGFAEEAALLIDAVREERGDSAYVRSMDLLHEVGARSEPDGPSRSAEAAADTSLHVWAQIAIIASGWSQRDRALELVVHMLDEEVSRSDRAELVALRAAVRGDAEGALVELRRVPADNAGPAWVECACMVQQTRGWQAAGVLCRAAPATAVQAEPAIRLLEAAADVEIEPSRSLGTLYRLRGMLPDIDLRPLEALCLAALGRNAEHEKAMREVGATRPSDLTERVGQELARAVRRSRRSARNPVVDLVLGLGEEGDSADRRQARAFQQEGPAWTRDPEVTRRLSDESVLPLVRFVHGMMNCLDPSTPPARSRKLISNLIAGGQSWSSELLLLRQLGVATLHAARATASRPALLDALLAISSIYERIGLERPEEAVLMAAAALSRQGSDPERRGAILLQLAKHHLRVGQAGVAESALLEAMGFAAEVGPGLRVRLLEARADAHRHLNLRHMATGLEHVSKLAPVYTSNYLHLRPDPPPPESVETPNGPTTFILSSKHEQFDALSRVLAEIRTTRLSVADRDSGASYLEGWVPALERAVEIGIEIGLAHRAFEVLESFGALSLRQRVGLWTGPRPEGVVESDWNRLDELLGILRKGSAAIGEGGPDQPLDYRFARSEARRLVSRLSRDSDNLRPSLLALDPLSTNSVGEPSLPGRTRIITLFGGPRSCGVWLLDPMKPDEPVWHELSTYSQARSDALAREFDDVSRGDADGWESLMDVVVRAREYLDEHLWLPLRDRGCLDELEHIVTVSHGSIQALPLHVSEVAPCPVSYAPSTRWALQGRTVDERLKKAVVAMDSLGGAAQDGARKWALPGARVEGQFVTQLLRGGGYDVSCREGSEATADWFVSSSAGASTIHLALHALSEPGSPDRSGILLASRPVQDERPVGFRPVGMNGQVTAADDGIGELLTLSHMWSALRLDRCQLAVLAGCHTSMVDWSRGVGDYSGIAGGWLEAGARSVVGSNWPVHDLSTLLLTADLYTRVLQHGESASGALWKAQRWLSEATAETIVECYAELIVESLYPGENRDVARGDLVAVLGAHGARRPFEHPVHWGSLRCYGI